jgi:hypothetical protein
MLYEGVSARPTTIPLAEVRESVSGQPMSAAGQSRHFGRRPTTSVMLSTTEVGRRVSRLVAWSELMIDISLKSSRSRCTPLWDDANP